MSKTYITSHRAKAVLLLAAVDAVFYCSSDPSGNLFIIIVGCVLLALTVYVLSRVGVGMLAYIVSMTNKTQKRVRLFSTFLIVFFILMRSIGQLSGRDVLATLPLIIGAYFYVAYNDSRRSNRDDKARTYSN